MLRIVFSIKSVMVDLEEVKAFACHEMLPHVYITDVKLILDDPHCKNITYHPLLSFVLTTARHTFFVALIIIFEKYLEFFLLNLNIYCAGTITFCISATKIIFNICGSQSTVCH